MKLKSYLRIVIKAFCYLIPKFIRDQYRDSVDFYLFLLKLIKNKRLKAIGRQEEPKEMMVLLSVADEMSGINATYKTLLKLKNRRSSITPPCVMAEDKLIHKLEALAENVLDVHLCIFDNVSVVGLSDSLIYNNKIYHQELSAMKAHHDLKRRDLFVEFDVDNKKFITLDVKNVKKYEDNNCVYISLLKEHSINYYHWVTENVSRLALLISQLKVDKNKIFIENKKVIFLVDEGLPRQCIEIINLIVDFDFNIQTVSKAELCQCSNLIYCSPFWQSLDNTTGTLNQEEFFIDKYAVGLVRKMIFNQINLDKALPLRKIYLKRKQPSMRALVNDIQVEEYMLSQGFDVVETVTMTFMEQVQLFNESSIIVGASGAAFTNILFMQPLAKVIIFFPSHPAINYSMFQPLADVSGVNLIHYQTIPKDMESIHSDFMVDLTGVELLLRSGDEF